MTERTATARQPGRTGARSAGDSTAAGFERLYRANVEAVTSYFARRSADPHVVADLTADTFVTAITSFASFDPGKGTARSWVFGIARHVYAAVAGAIAGTLVAGGGTPAYALTKNPDGTITLAVYQKSGIAQANARLRQLGDKQVVVVPVEAGCPKPPPPAVSDHGVRISMQFSVSRDGSVTVNAQGIPAGDILVVGMQASGHNRNEVGIVTSPPAPNCISPPAPPSGNGGSEARLRAKSKPS